MKAFSTTFLAGAPHAPISADSPSHTWGMVVVSLFLGMPALVVTFGAAAAFEVQGRSSDGELIAPCVAAALYLAFCQFWVAPRGQGRFWAKLLTLVASVAPLLLANHLPPRIWVPVSGCLGSLLGAMIAQRLTAAPQGEIQTTDSGNHRRCCRRSLLAGFILLVAIALLMLIGVIPSVLADTASDFNARPVGVFLGATVAFDLLVAALLASAVWRSREHEHTSKATLGIAAFLALFLTPAYFACGILVGGHGPAMRIASVVLFLCAVLGLATTALMSVTSVIVDRARSSGFEPEKELL